MTRSPAGRSGRPPGAAGPLVSALLAVATTVGLGCAAVGPAPAGLDGLGGSSGQATVGENATTRAPVLQLRPAAARAEQSAAPARRTQPTEPAPAGRTRPVRESRPAPPVVDARLRAPDSSRENQPTGLVISAADLDVPVRATGVAADGSMELPDTVRRAGWYRYSAPPGSTTGSTVIAAHVDTRAEGLGPFARLADLDRGDRVEVVDRSGDRHRYRVERIRRITRTKLPVDELFDRTGTPRLVLITCGGAYDARNGYRDNVVVLAEPDP